MDSKQIRGLCEAYVAVYDEDLRHEIIDMSLDEDLSFIDDLSDNELVQIMEEILSEEEVTLQECLDIFEGELLSEARVDMDARAKARREYAASSEKSASEARKRSASAAAAAEREKTSERGRVVKKHAMKRLQVATTRAGRNLADKAKSAGQKAKTLGAGAVSAAAGGAAEVGRKLSSAKKKITGFIKRVGSAAKAGYSSAKKEFSGQSAREAKARTTGREMRRAARRQASASSGRDTSEFSTTKKAEKPSDPWRGSETKPSARPSVTTKSVKALSGSSIKGALPPAKQSSRQRLGNTTKPIASRPGVRIAGGSGFGNPERGVSTPQTTKKGMKTAAGAITKINASYEMIADVLAEELISEGYVSNVCDAYDMIAEMNDFDLYEFVESFKNNDYEEVETLDLYDVVLEHLLDEGYADSVESAEAIMVNMSEEWRNNILDSSRG